MKEVHMKILQNLKLLQILLLCSIFFVGIFPQDVKAETTTIALGKVDFDDHNGMSADISGRAAFCIKRGYPFRSFVSDIQMVKIGDITIADWIRKNLIQVNSGEFSFFGGWGVWELNGDHTGITYKSGQDTTNIPSSDVIKEDFDKEIDDDEDAYVSYKNETSISTDGTFKFSEIKGHEGAKNVYSTTVTSTSGSTVGITATQEDALAILNYYVYGDSSGYSSTIQRQVMQALTWAVEFDFITTNSISGTSRLTYKNSSGKYKSPAKTGTLIYSGDISCDEYIKKYIGSQYEAMKLYREVVWKTTNMRVVPSFAYTRLSEALLNPIHLAWDETSKTYTTTISDANGVLKYFDFTDSIDGVDFTYNDDGTLTISTKQKIANDGVKYNTSAVKSKLLPEDCKFVVPTIYRWSLEGTSKEFTYTSVKFDIIGKVLDSESGDYGEYDDVYQHSTTYKPACTWKWNCSSAHHAEWKSKDNPGCYHTNSSRGDLDCDEDHEHTDSCYKTNYSKGSLKCGVSQHAHGGGPNNQAGENGATTCGWEWTCNKRHIKIELETLSGTYRIWQPQIKFSADKSTDPAATAAKSLVDPVNVYIAIKTDDHTFDSETDVEIKLIDQDGNEADHVKVGELYKLQYIYTYTGNSKGFKIIPSTMVKPYYQYTYIARMQTPGSEKTIYEMRNKSNGTLISIYNGMSTSTASVPHAVLDIDKTNITIRGIYSTAETPYNDNTYTFDSGSSWNDKIYLDALTTDQFDDNYKNKTTNEIETSSENGLKQSIEVIKKDDLITVVWTYETDYEVFTSAVINATAYIEVDGDENHTTSYFDEKYSYGNDADHNYVGQDGYFSSEYLDENGTQSNNSINAHIITTKNSEYPTYALKNKIWQSDVEIQTSNPVLNTGAGITEHIYSSPGTSYHDVNYNLYYTITVTNPNAHIYWHKVRLANNKSLEITSEESLVNTSSDVYEFDLNTLIEWNASGSTLAAFNGEVVVVDHVKTGVTYLQRTIPTRLTVLTSGTATMNTSIYPNYDRLVYEDEYSIPGILGNGNATRLKLNLSTSHYPSNKVSTSSTIYPAMNPNIARPTNIQNTSKYDTTSSFNIVLSNGANTTIKDRLRKDYTQYSFIFNTSLKDNKVTFSHRNSVTFFKYSNTNYSYNGKAVVGATGNFSEQGERQWERYYISQILFKSNYTTKYQKELEEKGADYILETNSDGSTNAWIDMVNQNEYAIVAAGQGFELKVTVKYENTFLTQYLARYFGFNDAQSINVGSSKSDSTYLGTQYCNISALTYNANFASPDGKTHSYINGINAVDKLVCTLVTGSNVYKDLYCYMSDNPDVVYSAMGMYDTPIIFDRQVEYNEDYSVTTITYTMKKSTENGVASSFQTMKFYTNQLAPDSETQGIIYNGNLESGKHSITIWTPIVAATGFEYPYDIQDRYIGDAIEIGYTIKTTAADDSIVHIVQ
jgi:hypothetical protein